MISTGVFDCLSSVIFMELLVIMVILQLILAILMEAHSFLFLFFSKIKYWLFIPVFFFSLSHVQRLVSSDLYYFIWRFGFMRKLVILSIGLCFFRAPLERKLDTWNLLSYAESFLLLFFHYLFNIFCIFIYQLLIIL